MALSKYEMSVKGVPNCYVLRAQIFHVDKQINTKDAKLPYAEALKESQIVLLHKTRDTKLLKATLTLI